MVTVDVKNLFVYMKWYTISLGFDFSFPNMVYVSTVRQEKTCCQNQTGLDLNILVLALSVINI